MNVKFQQWNCTIGMRSYQNNRIAILLNDADDFSPVAVATVNIPSEALAQDEVIIKDYSENTGMTEALVRAGLIHRPHRMVEAGFTVADVCRLTEAGLRMASASAVNR
jgi:hypothetical protein